MHEATTPQRRKTLPPPERRQRILEVAADLFLQSGYEGVSVDAITRAAGGSKRDPYILFGDKLTLFRDVVAMLCQTSIDAICNVDAAPDLRSALIALGDSIVASLLSPKTLALHRLVVAEAARLPGIGQLFLQHGPARAYAMAADLLKHHNCNGVDAGGVDQRATVFVDALLGDLQLRSLVGEPITAEEAARKVRISVDLLLPALTNPSNRN